MIENTAAPVRHSHMIGASSIQQPAGHGVRPGNGNRCSGCLGPGGQESLLKLRLEFPDIHFLSDTGRCGKCEKVCDVYDLAFLLLLRWHGCLRSKGSAGLAAAYPVRRLRCADPATAPVMSPGEIRKREALRRLRAVD
ncbi:hypothetical protein [Leisingera sp. XS_AS12]|uniref:hypothetical protein n=1 Tax=Leisingera sp. XS_AS12 TaxID=3241294 RepID=UPI0035119B24